MKNTLKVIATGHDITRRESMLFLYGTWRDCSDSVCRCRV